MGSPSRPPDGGGPQRLGEFRVVRLLGRGGMGSGYEAEQEGLRRRVALKVFDADLQGEEGARRFEREAWIGGRLSHPHVVKVFAHGAEGAQHYIALELLGGGTLSEELAREKTSQLESGAGGSASRRDRIRRMVELLVPVADALHAVHEAGVIHRDVKPGNLLLSEDRSRLLLTDFGLARPADASQLTRRGDFLGTVRYMSPEQLLAGRMKLDRRSDVWSLGVTLYEAVTLALPFDAPTEEGYVAAACTRDPVPARRRNEAVQRDLETILLKCLEKDPERRYATAKDLADELRRFLAGEPVQARRPGPVMRAARALQRHRLLVGVALAAAALTGIGAWTIPRLIASGQREQRVRAVLEKVLETGRKPEEISAEWPALHAWLFERVAARPDDDLAWLARRASVKIVVSLPRSHALVSEDVYVDRSVQPMFDMPGTVDLVVSIEGAWDGSGWQPLGWTGIAGDAPAGASSGGVTEPLPLQVMRGTTLKDVAGGSMPAGPHALALRATLATLPRGNLTTIPEAARVAGLPLDELIPGWKEQAMQQESRSVGTLSVSCFTEYPPDFPRALDPAVADAATARIAVSKLVLLVARPAAGSRRIAANVGTIWEQIIMPAIREDAAASGGTPEEGATRNPSERGQTELLMSISQDFEVPAGPEGRPLLVGGLLFGRWPEDLAIALAGDTALDVGGVTLRGPRLALGGRRAATTDAAASLQPVRFVRSAMTMQGSFTLTDADGARAMDVQGFLSSDILAVGDEIPPPGRGTLTITPSRDVALAAQVSDYAGVERRFEVDVRWADAAAETVNVEPGVE